MEYLKQIFDGLTDFMKNVSIPFLESLFLCGQFFYLVYLLVFLFGFFGSFFRRCVVWKRMKLHM